MPRVNAQKTLMASVSALLSRRVGLLDPLLSRIERFGYAKTALVVDLAIVLGVVFARYYYSFITGYVVPDEAWYYNTYVLDKHPIGNYRAVFVAAFVLFFHDVHNVWQFFLGGMIYSSLWAVGSVALSYKIIKRLEPSDQIAGLLLLSLPLFPVFIVLAPTILTEPMGFFFALLGVYLTLRFIQGGSAWNAVLSGVSMVFAFKVREPYLILGCGLVLLYLIAPALQRKMHGVKGLMAYTIPIAYIFPVPLALRPLQFAQPGTQIVENLKSSLLSHINVLAKSINTVTSNPFDPVISSIANPIVNPQISISAGNPAPIDNPDVLQGIVIGLGYGFNPLFAIFAVASLAVTVYLTAKMRSLTPLLVFFNIFFGLGSFLASVMFTIAVQPGAITGWTSSIIRSAHTALPGYFGLGPVYTRVKPKRVAALMLIVLIIGSTQAVNVADAFQKSLSRLPVDRLTLDYRAPAYRMYLIAKDSAKTLVIGGLHFRTIRMYMAMLPNVALTGVPPNEATFRALLNQTWDSIYLYDDWVTIAVPDMISAYPAYYVQILQSKGYMGYSIDKLWVDGESYALKMIRSGASSSVPQGIPPSGADDSQVRDAQPSIQSPLFYSVNMHVTSYEPIFAGQSHVFQAEEPFHRHL